MTRDEANRKLAEWVGYVHRAPRLGDELEAHATTYSLWFDPEHMLYRNGRMPPDFFSDEVANAKLLDKMRPRLRWTESTQRWMCVASEKAGFAVSEDRKTAICEAALAYLAAQEAVRP